MAPFRPDVLSEQKIRDIIEQVEKCQVDKVVKCSIKAGCEDGENYMGELAEVEAEAVLIRKEGTENKSYHWMVKLVKPFLHKGLPNIVELLNLFEREGDIYANIIPKYLELEPESLPICNFIYRQEKPQPQMIILDHMSQFGYKGARNKRQGLDLDHCRLVVQWLARFHSLGHVTMTRYPGGKEAWRKDNGWATPLDLFHHEQLEALSEAYKDDMLKATLESAAAIQGDRDYVERHKRMAAKYDNRLDKFRKESFTTQRPFLTLLHGDPWFNNMLFKYSDRGQVENVLLLDLQCPCYAHPGVDLTYFLMSSTTYELRKEHLKDLLKLYWTTLLDTAQSLGEPIPDYCLEDVKEDYKVGMKKGFDFALGAVPFITRESHEVEKMSHEKEGLDFNDPNAMEGIFKEGNEARSKILEKNPAVKARICGIYEDMIEAGLL